MSSDKEESRDSPATAGLPTSASDVEASTYPSTEETFDPPAGKYLPRGIRTYLQL